MASSKPHVCPNRCCMRVLAVLGSSGGQTRKLLHSGLQCATCRLLGGTTDHWKFLYQTLYLRLLLLLIFRSKEIARTCSTLPWDYFLSLRHSVGIYSIVNHFPVSLKQWLSSFFRRHVCKFCHHQLLLLSLPNLPLPLLPLHHHPTSRNSSTHGSSSHRPLNQEQQSHGSSKIIYR